jgi:small subunit ribosomal protein S19e
VSTVYLVPTNEFIKGLTEELRKNFSENIKPPAWAEFVKTGVHKSRTPTQSDWWFTRCASVLRKIYVKKTIGVSRLRAEYGGGKNRGSAPVQARSGSGSIVRKILQELESASLVEKNESNGRRLTAKGVSLLDRVAHRIRTSLQKEAIPELRKY